MTFDEYTRVIGGIHAELKGLVDSASNGGLVETAAARQADLEALIQRHVELVKLSTQLTERLFSHYKTGR